MQRFAHQVVVITGAASGIGRAAAQAFAREGARVHALDIDADGVAAVASQLGGGACGYGVDLRDAEAVQAVVDSILERDARVDVLYCNAGVVVSGAAAELSLADWRLAIDTNLLGVIHPLHALLPRLVKQTGGAHVLMTASMAGLVGFPMVAPYSASKFAVVGLAESLAAELAGQGVRVTALCPGAVRTGIMTNSRTRLSADWSSKLASLVERTGQSPESVAEVALQTVIAGRTGVIPVGLTSRLFWRWKRTSPGSYLGVMREAVRLLL